MALRVQVWEPVSLTADYVEADPNTTLVGHRHAEPHAMVVLDGAMADHGRVYAPGDARISAPHDAHVVRFLEPTRCLVVTGGHDRIPRVCDRWSGTLLPPQRVNSGILKWGRRRSFALSSGELQGLVDDVLNQLTHQAERVRREMPPPWLVELRGRVTRDAGIRRSVDHWARRAGVSREHLTRSFRRHYGTSFVAFRMHQRVAMAHQLLRTTGTNLSETALIASFADQSHMTRAFRRCLGTTPALVAAGATTTQVTNVQAMEAPDTLASRP